jgi:hypothetical protein
VALVLLIILLPMLGVVLFPCRRSAVGGHSGCWTLPPAAASFLRNPAFVAVDCRGVPCCRPLERCRTLGLHARGRDGLRLLFTLLIPRIEPFSRCGRLRYPDTAKEEMAKPHGHREERLAIAAPWRGGYPSLVP